jgi:hypothetical protein
VHPHVSKGLGWGMHWIFGVRCTLICRGEVWANGVREGEVWAMGGGGGKREEEGMRGGEGIR